MTTVNILTFVNDIFIYILTRQINQLFLVKTYSRCKRIRIRKLCIWTNQLWRASRAPARPQQLRQPAALMMVVISNKHANVISLSLSLYIYIYIYIHIRICCICIYVAWQPAASGLFSHFPLSLFLLSIPVHDNFFKMCFYKLSCSFSAIYFI